MRVPSLVRALSWSLRSRQLSEERVAAELQFRNMMHPPPLAPLPEVFFCLKRNPRPPPPPRPPWNPYGSLPFVNEWSFPCPVELPPLLASYLPCPPLSPRLLRGRGSRPSRHP